MDIGIVERCLKEWQALEGFLWVGLLTGYAITVEEKGDEYTFLTWEIDEKTSANKYIHDVFSISKKYLDK